MELRHVCDLQDKSESTAVSGKVALNMKRYRRGYRRGHLLFFVTLTLRIDQFIHQSSPALPDGDGVMQYSQ